MNSGGQGISKARVFIAAAADETVQASATGNFGYYRFNDISAGQTYILGASHKSVNFSPQAVTVLEEVENINFVALP